MVPYCMSMISYGGIQSFFLFNSWRRAMFHQMQYGRGFSPRSIAVSWQCIVICAHDSYTSRLTEYYDNDEFLLKMTDFKTKTLYFRELPLHILQMATQVKSMTHRTILLIINISTDFVVRLSLLSFHYGNWVSSSSLPLKSHLFFVILTQ